MTRSLALATVASMAAACSTNYVPRTPGRVFVTMESGTPTYVRDGQSHRHGFLGGGLKKAVRGNPQAERAAEEYSDRLRDGLLVTVLGGVCMGTALGMAMGDAIDDESDRHTDTKLLVALGCTVLMFGGTFYAVSAEPYRWDAINIFNDNPPPPPPGMYPGYGPGYGAAKAPAPRRLGMRE
jgi:hypothetical protein